MNYVFIQASSYILGYMRKKILALDFPKIPSNHSLMIFFPLLSIFIKTFFWYWTSQHRFVLSHYYVTIQTRFLYESYYFFLTSLYLNQSQCYSHYSVTWAFLTLSYLLNPPFLNKIELPTKAKPYVTGGISSTLSSK